MERDEKHYHILNIENPNKKNVLETSCCLIKDGKLFKLPACDECFNRLKKADEFLKKDSDIGNTAASLDASQNADDKGLSTWDAAIGMLKRLSFKRCDLGRMPKSVPKIEQLWKNSCYSLPSLHHN